MKIRTALLFTGLAAAALSNANAANLLTDNFEDISTLAGNGWAFTNNSSPLGATGWFQGNGVLTAQAGTTDSYIGANFTNATPGGNISNWLILPTLTLDDGDTLSFYTQSTQFFADNLEVRFSGNGTSSEVGSTSSSVGDFTNLLLEVNPTYAATGYPSAWARYVVTLTGLGGPVSGRLAFRYVAPDTNTNGDYIGIDTLSVDEASAVPEPATLSMLLGGISILTLTLRKRSTRRNHDAN